ncbi:hypothetical protein [Treponema endosymbiont of Eucomonympha sp.]|nr:hypothetical protein [Treponema endosymbiont of Eucomonympha sp.]
MRKPPQSLLDNHRRWLSVLCLSTARGWRFTGKVCLLTGKSWRDTGKA